MFVCYGKKLQPLPQRNGSRPSHCGFVHSSVSGPFDIYLNKELVMGLPLETKKTQPYIHFNLNLDCFRPLSQQVVNRHLKIEHKEPSSSSSSTSFGIVLARASGKRMHSHQKPSDLAPRKAAAAAIGGPGHELAIHRRLRRGILHMTSFGLLCYLLPSPFICKMRIFIHTFPLFVRTSFMQAPFGIGSASGAFDTHSR